MTDDSSAALLRRWEVAYAEPARGLEPRTFRLQDSFSVLTMTATSDFTVYSDRFGGYSGASGPEFVSQVVSRWHRRCDLRIDPIGLHGTARSAPRTVSGMSGRGLAALRHWLSGGIPGGPCGTALQTMVGARWPMMIDIMGSTVSSALPRFHMRNDARDGRACS